MRNRQRSELLHYTVCRQAFLPAGLPCTLRAGVKHINKASLRPSMRGTESKGSR